MSGPLPSTPLLPRATGAFPGPALLWRTGALLAAAGIVAGAFGSHGLRKRPGITPDKVHAWETASHYAVFNGLALLLVSLHPRFAVHRFAGPAIAVGASVFSGSILALVLARDRFRWLGPITPIGGSILIAGYIALAF
ncbi:hypothetical protein DICSQDRAFT_151365 [Dichomitus squalens LYAD-421 SS1]|uniref:DUF423-domain-containing protein n=1 Tax=Dichomitus squalens TaxID=114155 RepID=A0A4Q9N250_9APHY|nr:uncharacterized protein DICSQDRAFT_151365 [Dichomitus squalens LYAD-421 SS1]EJF66986.1 hypothetical protein DICSQDRAFT_151365 [Dichomitus squalens LYAD-421 SS1]TBU34594.1 hypothetical protein BD311DRAFT_746432 [Dichomitus squalens]TBU63621.1 hypothetical protein BD310DRAFT_955216 [Dichomitus squalens]